jgi:uncharacterized delta-60 repeat protein
MLVGVLACLSIQASAPSAQAAAGDLDVTFGVGGKVTTRLGSAPMWSAAMAVQADGRIVAAGYQGLAPARDFLVVRYNQDGSLDSAFGASGATTTDFGGDDLGRTVALQADGKILVAGSTSVGQNVALVRYLPSGAIDTSFGTSGKVTTQMGSNDTARGIVVLPSGGILIAGNTGSSRLALAQYTQAGGLDPGFGSGGLATASIGTAVAGYDLLVQADGRILVGGTAAKNTTLARFLSNGSLDGSFGSAGIAAADLGGTEAIHGLALQPDGSIVAAATAVYGKGQTDAVVLRFTPSGALDPGFGSGGIAMLDPLTDAWAILVTENGSIVVGGGSGGDASLARLQPGGTLDASFGGDGLVTIDFGAIDLIKDLAIQADGSVVTAGYTGTDADGFSFALSRLLTGGDGPGGTLDASFGAGGLVVTEMLGGPDGWGTAMAIQPNGQIVVVGAQGLSPVRDLAVVRYQPNGSVDSGFGVSGQAITNVGRDELARDVALQPDGKIIVVGTSSEDVVVARYLVDGQLDPTFGTAGVSVLNLGITKDTWDAWRGVVVQPDGRIIAAGFVSQKDFAVARYLSNGTLDPSFGVGGVATTDFGGAEDWGFGMALQPDGKVVVAGYSGSDAALARYLANGSLDPTFGTGGKVTTDFGETDVASAVALQADGKAVIAGYSGTGGRQHIILARYQDGVLDASFGSGGKVLTDLPNGTEKARSLAIQSDGKIVAAGYLNVSPTSPREFGVTRYLPDGSIDTQFGSAGTVWTDFAGNSDDWIHDVAIQADGRIVAFGQTGWGPPGTYAFALARYLP